MVKATPLNLLRETIKNDLKTRKIITQKHIELTGQYLIN